MTLSRRALLALPVPLLLLAACGGGTVTATPGDDGTGPAAGVPDADTPVLQVTRAGGFVPPLSDVRALPALVVLADGRVLTPAAQIEVFPPPALGAAQVGRAADGAVADLRARAVDAGLDREQPGDVDPPRGATVADLPATFVTYWTEDGTAHVHRFSELETDAPRSPRQEKVYALVQHAQRLATGDELLEPERLGVWARDVTTEAPDPEMPPQVEPWPLADQPPSPDACLTLDGADAAAVVEAAQGTNTETRWSAGGKQYVLALRPLLPHAADCAAAAPPA